MVDYTVPADLYPGRHHKFSRTTRYQRFPSLAEAVQFTIEKLPASSQPNALIEADEVRYDGNEIRALYFSESYPLRRAFDQGS